jgi:hypothetical protein
MEILRLKSTGSSQVAIQLPEIDGNYQEIPLVSNVIYLADMSTTSSTEFSFEEPGGNSYVEYLPNAYDADYLVEIRYQESGDLIAEETFELRRPYVNPNSISTSPSRVAEYAQSEELARAIIDSIIPEGFYYKKETIETTGLGADYIPVWKNAKKIVAVYENNQLVTDRTFEFSKDMTAVIQTYADRLNREESASILIPLAASDAVDFNYQAQSGFPKTFDYRLVLETGYTTVPSDIVRATKLLIEDIECGKLDYYKRYLSDYSTDQFKLKFDAKLFGGTGNLIVDKILSKYEKSIKFIGVL